MKIIFATAAVLLGFFIGVAGLSFAGKPSNTPISLDPVEALSTYFFSFSWIGGILGALIGAVFLLGYLTLWFYAGVRVYKS